MAVLTVLRKAVCSASQKAEWSEVLWVENWAELRVERLVALRAQTMVERSGNCSVAAKDCLWAAWRALQWVVCSEQKLVDTSEETKAGRKGSRTAAQRAGVTARPLVALWAALRVGSMVVQKDSLRVVC